MKYSTEESGKILEERGLVSEEQGWLLVLTEEEAAGIRLLTLMLLGQIKVCSSRGRFATLTDFRKVVVLVIRLLSIYRQPTVA